MRHIPKSKRRFPLICRIAAPLLVLPLLSACGKHSSGKKIKDIFIHGDPAVLYAGAKNDATPIIKTADVASFKNFNLYGGSYFQERSHVSHSTNAEEGNEATTGDDISSINHYGFEQTATGWAYHDASAGADDIVFNFVDQGGSLVLQSVRMDGATDTPVEVIHNSMTPAKDAFSLLLKTTDPDDGNGALGIWFTKNQSDTVTPVRDDTEYKFLLGPGILAAWPDAITIDICGDASDAEVTEMQSAFNGWATNGKIGTHTLTVGRRADYAPFTDLNSHCIKMIDNFYFEDQDDAATYGITMSAVNKTTSSISSSNIIISRKAFDKTPGIDDKPESRGILLSYVTAHEFGHFLGLDHEFTKLADGETPKYSSIMSYEFDNIADATPRTHDRESIAKLYAGTFHPNGTTPVLGSGTQVTDEDSFDEDDDGSGDAADGVISIAADTFGEEDYTATLSCQAAAGDKCLSYKALSSGLIGSCPAGLSVVSSCPAAARVGGCKRNGDTTQGGGTFAKLILVTTWYYSPKKTHADVVADCH